MEGICTLDIVFVLFKQAEFFPRWPNAKNKNWSRGVMYIEGENSSRVWEKETDGWGRSLWARLGMAFLRDDMSFMPYYLFTGKVEGAAARAGVHFCRWRLPSAAGGRCWQRFIRLTCKPSPISPWIIRAGPLELK